MQPGKDGKNLAFRWNKAYTAPEKFSLGDEAELLLQPRERLQVNWPAGRDWGIPKASGVTCIPNSHV